MNPLNSLEMRRVLAVVVATAMLALPLQLGAQPVPNPEPQPTDVETAGPAEMTEPDATDEDTPTEPSVTSRPVSSGERVGVGTSVKVEAGETVSEAITVLGDSEVNGEVRRDMVTVVGDALLNGSAGGDMVTVFGDAKLNGSAGGDMVTVFGRADVNGPVGGDLVVVFGSLRLGPKALVKRDCIVVFGTIEMDPAAQLERAPKVILPQFAELGEYLRSGPLLGRPLPPKSALAWIGVGLHFVLYFLIVLILPKPVAASLEQLNGKPLQSFGVGLLALILLAPLLALLVATGVGIILIPFVLLAEVLLAVVGKTATLGCIGTRVLRLPADEANRSLLLAFVTGFVVVTLIYMVPIAGLLVWLALRPLALGAALMALFAAWKKNGNGGGHGTAAPIPVYTAPPGQAPVAAGVSRGFAAGAGAAPESSPEPGGIAVAAEAEGQPSIATPTPAMPSTPEVAMMPRAGFWIRAAASALDLVLFCWIIPFLGPFFLLIWLAYHIGMWTWKGTTIGGIVCSLKVVRLEGRPVDFTVSLVRGLGSVFSAAALLLGFFWVGWTRERQSWHDKIAGTVIVRVPKGISLI